MTTAWGGGPPNLNDTTQTHWGAEGIGILGSVMKSSWTAGEHGASPLDNDALADGLEYRWYVDSVPAGCTIIATELGDAELWVPADGIYTYTYRLVEAGALLPAGGSIIAYVGVASAPVSAAVSGLASTIVSAAGGVAAVVNPPSVVTATVAGLAATIADALGGLEVSIGDLPVTPEPVQQAMVEWDLWSPFILPYADECPEATMLFHVRQAAIEFCRVTRAWQANVTELIADGASTVFALQGPADSEVGLLLKVTVLRNGYQAQNVEVVTPDIGIDRMNSGDMQPCAYSDSAGSMVLWPAQPAGARIVARAVLRPSIAAGTCPQFLYEQYATEVAAGALGSILALPGKPWTDLKTAAIHAAQFNSRKNTVMLVVRRGNASSTRTTATRWF